MSLSQAQEHSQGSDASDKDEKGKTEIKRCSKQQGRAVEEARQCGTESVLCGIGLEMGSCESWPWRDRKWTWELGMPGVLGNADSYEVN